MPEVVVRGVPIAYLEAGRGEPLVCVHGNFASKRWFTDLLESPPPNYRIIALDLPNFAASAAMPEAISIATYADYLAGFIAALGFSQPVLLGHSLGGAVVQAVLAQQPDAAKAALLLASAPPGGVTTPEAHYAVLESFRADRTLLAEALGPTMPTKKPAYFEALVDDAFMMRPEAFTGNARALDAYDFSGSLWQVACPVLVISGEHDYLISETMARATAEAFRCASHEHWQGVGHSPQIEAPERFGERLHSFLKEVS